MNEQALQRLFGWRQAFADPGTAWLVGGVFGALLLASLVIAALAMVGRVQPKTKQELIRRTVAWWVMAPLLLGPILAGAAWTILGVIVLSLFCYREFARATGLFRERFVSAFVAFGILALAFAVLDHWYGLFMALIPLVVVSLGGLGVLLDRPDGYIQRTALGVFAFLLFGVCLAHVAYFANDGGYRPMLVLLLVAVELNDVFAYVCGRVFGARLFGGRKLMPNTSPNKTRAGAVGALVLSSLLMVGIGPLVFVGPELHGVGHMLALGAIVAVGGQLGDLMLSAIKRDLGIKDFAATIPGHGGLLDRFDSLLLVAPAAFHYVGYVRGIGLDDAARIFSGG